MNGGEFYRKGGNCNLSLVIALPSPSISARYFSASACGLHPPICPDGFGVWGLRCLFGGGGLDFGGWGIFPLQRAACTPRSGVWGEVLRAYGFKCVAVTQLLYMPSMCETQRVRLSPCNRPRNQIRFKMSFYSIDLHSGGVVVS